MKLGLSIGQQNNINAAFLLLEECRPRDLDSAAMLGGVLHTDRAAAPCLNAMMEYSIRRQRVRSKARARVVDLKQRNGAAGVIFDCRFDVM